jgi:hypothetical protein
VRNLLIGLTVIGGLALAGRPRTGDETPPSPSQAADPLDAALSEPVPGLFPDGLPVAIQEVPEGLASISAQSCNACHWAAHDQWQDTAHASAWRSPSYQAAIERAGNATVCTQCHLPLANQHAKLATSYIDEDLSRPILEDNPAWDATLMAEGIGCAGCHVREGTVLGVREAPGAPHPVTASTELTDSAACATCHQLSWPGGDRPFYDTYGEWDRSVYKQAGVDCQDCHMPPVAAPVAASTFAGQASHTFSADLARAVTALVSMPSPDIQRGVPVTVALRVLNTGSGHHFPTGSPFKSYRLSVELLGADGSSIAEPLVYDFARVVEEVPPYLTLSDSRIPAGGEVELVWDLEVEQSEAAQGGIIRIAIQPVGTGERPVTLQDIPVKIL